MLTVPKTIQQGQNLHKEMVVMAIDSALEECYKEGLQNVLTRVELMKPGPLCR